MSDEPYLSARAVRAALDALRQAAPLGEHVLTDLLIVRRQQQTPEAVEGAAAGEQVVYQLLIAETTDQLNHLRLLEGMSPTADLSAGRPEVEEALKRDFLQGNTELEAWSVLYHRYVRVDLDFQIQTIAVLTRQDLRTLRRRRARGVARLTTRLIEAERAARARQSRLRMRLALPVAAPPALLGVDEVAARALEALADADPKRPVVLHGAGGVGKTALAVWLAHRLIEQNAIDDLVWLQGARPDALPARLLEGLGRREAYASHTDADPLVALRAHAQTYRLLIVLDAAEALMEDPNLDEQLDALGAARVLITSRVAPPVAGRAQLITLHELDELTAFALMERETELLDTPRRAEQFGRVWEAVGGNPLALRVAVGHLRLFAPDHVTGRLGVLPVGETSLFDALYRAAWGALDEDARRLWLALLLFPSAGAANMAELESLAGDKALGALERALVTLARRALVEVNPAATAPPSTAAPRYTLPRLSRAFLESVLAEDIPLDGASARAFVRDNARALAAMLTASDAPAEVIFERGAHLLAHAAPFGLDVEPLLDLAPIVHASAASAGRWATWAPILRNLLDADRATLLVWLGEAERHLGRLDEAARLLLEAIDLVPETRPPAPRRAAALVELASVYRLAGRGDDAEVAAEQGHRAFAALGDTEGVAHAAAELAQVQLDTGRPERALRLLSETPKPQAQRARLQALLGNVYLSLGRLDAALEAHRQALDLARQGAHQLNLARALVNLGRAELVAGDLNAAEASFEQALGIMGQTRDALGRIRARANLAVLYAHRGHHRQALDLLRAVLAEQEAFGDRQGAAVSRQNLAELRLRAAEAALKRGQMRAAMRHLDVGQALYVELGMYERADAARQMVNELRADYDVS